MKPMVDRRRPMVFDTTINVGQIVSVIGLLIALWSMSARLEHRFTALETKVDALERSSRP